VSEAEIRDQVREQVKEYVAKLVADKPELVLGEEGAAEWNELVEEVKATIDDIDEPEDVDEIIDMDAIFGDSYNLDTLYGNDEDEVTEEQFDNAVEAATDGDFTLLAELNESDAGDVELELEVAEG
jgi:hypothetical protein